MAWDVDQPAVKYVRELVFKYFPAVSMAHDITLSRKANKSIMDHPAHGVGGRVQRTTASGGFSRHSEGRAADIYVNVKNAYLKRFGDELFQRFAANARSLGLEDLIWNDQIWSAAHPTVHAYTDTDHRDHLHMGFSRIASQHIHQGLEGLIREAAEVTDAAFPVPKTDLPFPDSK